MQTNCVRKVRSFLVAGKLSGVILHVLNRHATLLKHAALLKLKHAALFLIMQLVLGLIMLRVSIMLRVDLARGRLPLIISLPPKKTAPAFLTQVSLHYFTLAILQRYLGPNSTSFD